MTVTTVFANTPGGNGACQTADAVYATARTKAASIGSNNHVVGQDLFSGTYHCIEAFLDFDTSGIPDTDTISDVVLSLDGNANNSTQDFVAQVAVSSTYNGGPVVTGDYLNANSLAALTVLATWYSSGYSANYNAFTDSGSFPAAINVTGNTFLILYSDRLANNITPTTLEQVTFTDADAAGTTTDPKLDITHAAGGGGALPWLYRNHTFTLGAGFAGSGAL